MRISSATFARLALRVDYRLVYSPASKHLWAADSLAGAPGTWRRRLRQGDAATNGRAPRVTPIARWMGKRVTLP